MSIPKQVEEAAQMAEELMASQNPTDDIEETEEDELEPEEDEDIQPEEDSDTEDSEEPDTQVDEEEESFEELVIQIGTEDGELKKIYVKNARFDYVFRVESTFLEEFPEKAEDWKLPSEEE